MPTDGSDEFAAERLHPEVTYWCCRPTPVARHFRFASIKRPVKLRREYASEYDMPGSVQSERTQFTAALHDAATIDYVYDFGDNWHHRIKLEKTLPSEAQLRPPLCVAGTNATPPDDCGGVYGHYEFVAAVTDPNRPEHAEMAEWIGRPWDPSEFDIGRVNAYLSNIKV